MDDATKTRGWARDWLQGLYDQNGLLTPDIVREAARPEDSPAHHYVFNLPPDQAAEAHYLDRAHELIRSVKIRYAPRPDVAPRMVRAFPAIPSDEAAFSYEPLDVIMREPDKFDQVKKAALRRLRDAESAVEDLDFLVADNASRSTPTKKALKSVRSARETLSAVA